ncbi:hypothetical protein [Mucilaginibacter jinjuensis]|uniref:Uncharacterized protein n=1 Tax=Mucilaginibacter jinjuensis TaxID=1176721 RepID=A0ABY7T9L4_9SPHI|nr:hypothetical protein [Mucilaginibacter jinjuensis]WCT13052.1 hypothetical protein PQO05_03780 [Mucilaginibacter jinjuensis]
MKLRDFKLGLCIMFMGIFMTKMFISVAPVFMSLNNKTVNAVITQLELESKNDKEDPDKGTLKEKKFFDEDFVFTIHDYKPLVVEINILHRLEKSLYTQVYHPVVPTPPPNA